MVKPGYKQTDLGLLPEEWACREIGSFADVCMCKRIFAEQTSEMGEIPFYKIGTFGKKADAYISRPLFEEYKQKYSYPQKGDVLISAAGTLGRTVVYDGEEAYFQDSNIVWLDIDKSQISNDYLYHYYKVIKWTPSEGSTIARLYNGIITSTNVAVPPKPEQEAIAEALTDIDTLIVNLEKLIAKKKAIKKGAIQELLTGKRRLPGFNGEWKSVKLGDYCTVLRGGSPRPIQAYLTSSSQGANWIKIGDVREGDKYITSTAERIIEAGICKSREVFVGDFILSNSMSFGRPYILKIDGCIHDGWLVIQNYQESFDQQYLYYVLGSDFVKAQYIAMAAGSSVQNLNKEKVSNVTLYKPDIEEQQNIASILSDMDEEISGYEAKLAKYIGIKQGMMSELLTGRIRLV